MRPQPTYGTAADSALRLWVKLSRAHATFERFTKRDIARYGLTEPQFAVLETLGHLGPLRQCDLSRKLLVTGGNTSLVVDNLEKGGIVRRERDPDDRRAMRVRLTPKGKSFFGRIFPQHAAAVTAAAAVLTAKEQQQLSRLLRKLGLALAEGLEDGDPSSRQVSPYNHQSTHSEKHS